MSISNQAAFGQPRLEVVKHHAAAQGLAVWLAIVAVALTATVLVAPQHAWGFEPAADNSLLGPAAAPEEIVAGESFGDDSCDDRCDDCCSAKRPQTFGRGLFKVTGARAGQQALWGPPQLEIADWRDDYERIRALDNGNPNSLFYTNRANIFGQDVPDEWDWINLISTDRPDFTDATFTVGKGITMLETGYTFRRVIDTDTRFTTRQLPETLIRYGVTKDFELRLKWNGYLMLDQRDLPSGARVTQFGSEDLGVACKWQLFEQQNWRPKFLVVAGALVPSGTRGFSGNDVQPHVFLLQGWQIRRWLHIKHGFGWDYLTQPEFAVAANDIGIPVFSTQHPVLNLFHESISILTQWTRRVGAFHEWFALFGPNQTASHFLDMGIYFYLTPSVQLDAVIATRLSDRVDEMFAKAGFSTRW
jgi:hypothetical protein